MFFDALNSLCEGEAQISLLGDLNLSDLDWDTFIHPDNKLYNTVANFICDNGLNQLINIATHVNNILDIILTTDPMCIDKIDLLPPMGQSDHCSILFTITLSFIATQKAPLIQKLNFNRANWENFAS